MLAEGSESFLWGTVTELVLAYGRRVRWEARGRVAFAALWLGAQGVLVVTADVRPDRAFGFRMFNESSTIEVHLSRIVRGRGEVPVEDGTWVASDTAGQPRTFRWRDRVPQPALSTFGTPIHASYGSEAQVERLRAALADVARHTTDDTETRELVLEVIVRKNGRAPTRERMTSGLR